MSVLTRIKNNQITDSTILANTKIVPGSIVGSLFNTNLTMTSDVTITGNLTVQGSSTYLTVASTNTYVNDPLIVMNNAFAGTNTNDIGLLFNRGSDTNQAFIWDESEDEFRLIATTETGDTYGAVTTSSYANVRVGNLNVEGAAAFGSLSTSGNIGAVNLTLSGDAAVNGGDLTTTATTFNLLTSDATTVNAFTAATTLELGAATGTTNINNNLDVDGNISVDGENLTVSATTFNLVNTTATTVNAFGAATTLTLGAESGTLTVRNALLDVDGNATVGGTLGVTGDSTLTGDLAVNGGDITTTATTFNLLDATAETVNAFGAATAIDLGATTGTLTINNPTVVGTQTTQDLYNTTATTLNFAGATTVLTIGATTGTANIRNATTNIIGNATVGGTLGVTGNATVTENLAVTGDTTLTGDLAVNGGDLTTTATTFNLLDATATTVNVFGAATAIDLGATTGILTINNPTVVGTQTSQDLYNTTATTLNFAGAATTLNIGSDTGTATINNDTVNLEGNVNVNKTTPSTNSTSGALVVDGGVGIAGNLNVGENVVITGNLTVQGDVTTLNTATLDVEDLNITVAKGAVDSAAANGAGLTVDGASATFTYANADDSWNVNKLFKGTSASFSANLGITGDTTLTGDLAVNGGDLTTTATTFNLLDATATTLNAFGAATTIDLGATTGTLTINNPTVVGTQTTQDLYNTTATTLNFAGAATTLNIGATTGTVSLLNANIWLPNAVTIDGAQATVNLLGNATTVDAFKAATDLEFGATTGTLTINNPTVVGTQASQDLYNSTATTLNFAGAATTLVAGATSGTFSLRNANLHLPNATTIHSSQTTVAVLNENVTTVNGFGAATALTLGATTGTASIRNATVAFPNATNIHVDQSSITVANVNATTVNAFGAATELNFAAAGGNTNVRGNVISNGILGAFAGISTTSPTLNPADGTTSFFVNGGSVLRGNVFITEEANISYANIYANTISTSSTTGALVVGGGVGLGANLNVSGGTVINIDQTAESFQVKGQFATTLIYANSTTDTVTIGGSNTTPISGATLRINGTGAVVLPVGTTSERPGTSGNVDVRGMLRLNSSLNTLEYYDGTAWQSSQGSFTVINSESFSGNGVATVFTMAGAGTTASTIVSINGIVQIPVTAYSIDDVTLTFTEAPEVGDTIDVRRLTTTASVDELGFAQNIFKANASYAYISTGSVSSINRFLIDTNGLVTVTGDMEIYGNLTVNGDTNGQINIGDSNTDNVAITAEINSNLVPNANNTYDLGSLTQRWRNVYSHATIHDETPTNVSASATPTLVDSFATSAYSSAKYLVQIKDGSDIQAAELLLVQDTANAFITTYGVLSSNVELGTFTANIASGNVNLFYTSTAATNSNVKVHTTYIV